MRLREGDGILAVVTTPGHAAPSSCGPRHASPPLDLSLHSVPPAGPRHMATTVLPERSARRARPRAGRRAPTLRRPGFPRVAVGPRTWIGGAATVAVLAVLAGGLAVHSGQDASATPLVVVTAATTVAQHSVQVTIDGVPRTVWTSSSDVGGLLVSLGLDPTVVYVSLPATAAFTGAGPALTIRTPKQITVMARGVRRQLTTTAATIGAALLSPAAGYDSSYQISVPATSPVVAGQTYKVVQVEVVTSVQQSITPIRTLVQSNASLNQGVQDVVQSGRQGIVRSTIWTRTDDGRVVDRKVLSTRVISTPQVRIIEVGTSVGVAGITYLKDFVPASGKVVGRAPNFAALAQCETHSRPTALNPSGKYRGMYQFDLRTWHGVGGVGDPIDASPQEQTYRAELLYNNRGRTPWPYCGRFL
jgi:uncharacterized protein YabE (DUF348 family)